MSATEPEWAWLNNMADEFIKILTNRCMSRLNANLPDGTYNLDDAWWYARSVLGKALATYKHLERDSPNINVAPSLALRDLNSVKTRRVVSCKITKAIKRQIIQNS